jgi:curved DNA-binding protein CbpA
MSIQSNNSDAENFYEVLGVLYDATAGEVRNAYHASARQLHPDAPGSPADATAQMAILNQAYSTLSDISQRRAYDQANGLGKYARIQHDPSEVLQQEDNVAPSSPLSAAVAVCSALAAICIGMGFALSSGGLVAIGAVFGIAAIAMSLLRFRQALGNGRT